MSAPPETNRILIIDGSKVVRRLIKRIVQDTLPEAEIVTAGDGAEALEALHDRPVGLATTALRLPDTDGLRLARQMRDAGSQHYFPIVVISGAVTQHLHREGVLAGVTDYFDKSYGFDALGAFIHGYLVPDPKLSGRVLLVEDSKVVSIATQRLLRKHGLETVQAGTVDGALERLKAQHVDLVLTDVTLDGDKSGYDLLIELRRTRGLNQRELPILAVTGESKAEKHAELLRAGANDLVEKPIEGRHLVPKLRFQLQLKRQADRRLELINE